MIPGLGDEESGYEDTNVFCALPSVALAHRIRTAYGYMFARTELDIKYTPPVSALIDLRAGRVQTVEAARFSDGVRERLHRTASTREVPEAAERLLAAFQKSIQAALAAPRVKLDRYVEGEYIRQRYVKATWPEAIASTMTLREFLQEFGPDEGTPWHRTWREILDEKARVEVGGIFGRSLEHLRRANTVLFAKASDQLRLGASEDEPSTRMRRSEFWSTRRSTCRSHNSCTGLYVDRTWKSLWRRTCR